jgi:hypothetical protein
VGEKGNNLGREREVGSKVGREEEEEEKGRERR